MPIRTLLQSARKSDMNRELFTYYHRVHIIGNPPQNLDRHNNNNLAVVARAAQQASGQRSMDGTMQAWTKRGTGATKRCQCGSEQAPVLQVTALIVRVWRPVASAGVWAMRVLPVVDLDVVFLPSLSHLYCVRRPSSDTYINLLFCGVLTSAIRSRVNRE